MFVNSLCCHQATASSSSGSGSGGWLVSLGAHCHCSLSLGQEEGRAGFNHVLEGAVSVGYLQVPTIIHKWGVGHIPLPPHSTCT